mgnify:CR=1 FL=1
MIDEIYEDVLLAAAAYADWSSDILEVEIKAELINKRGFTEAKF